jgi:purine-nucleoside phosphorylase
MPLLAISVITNMAAGVLDRPLSGAEVDETGKRVAGLFSRYLASIVREL